VVTADTVVEVFEAQALYGGSFDTNLLELGLIDERKLLPYLERAHGVQNRVDVYAEPAVDALQRVPRELAEAHRVCPFRLVDVRGQKTLEVVCADPGDGRALDEIATQAAARLAVNVATEARLALHLYRGYGTPMPNRLVSILKGRTWPKPLVSSRRARPPAQREPERVIEIDLTAPPLVAASAPMVAPAPLRVQAPDESATDQVLRVEPHELPLPDASSLPRSEAELARRLGALAERDQIPPIALGYLSALPRAALLRVRKTDIAGWDARGDGVDRDIVAQLSYPLDVKSIFAKVVTDVAPYEGKLPKGKVESDFVAKLGGGWPDQVVLAPIHVKGRPVAVLYAELPRQDPRGARDMVVATARHIAETLLRMILARKTGS
jgi:hypothetical protein